MSRRRRSSGKTGARTDLLGTLYPTLDLHGLTAAEAIAAARSWLEARRLASELTVRLITGRGLHSIGPAVLPGEIEDLLRAMRGSAIESFESEPGGGVYRVRLIPVRGRREAPPVHPIRDPGLIREAEEALDDLGIQPTPALLEAEIRRILQDRAKGTG